MMNSYQFMEMLQSFNLYPNKKVANVMFEVLDKNKDNQIDFEEFVYYLQFLMNGDKDEKIKFIFEMISPN